MFSLRASSQLGTLQEHRQFKTSKEIVAAYNSTHLLVWVSVWECSDIAHTRNAHVDTEEEGADTLKLCMGIHKYANRRVYTIHKSTLILVLNIVGRAYSGLS